MMDLEQMEREIKDRLNLAGLSPFLVTELLNISDLGGELYVDIVMSDLTKVAEAEAVVNDVLKGRISSLVVRPRWTIDTIYDPVAAQGPDGGLRAAVLLPVALRSGSETKIVTVSVTTAAGWEFDRILGRNNYLAQVARIVVESRLHRGGSSFWNPLIEDYLEVGSGAAANISRMLRQTA